MRIKCSKTWDMQHHWLREATVRKALEIYWDKGDNNDADYYTKHHFPTHHKLIHPRHTLKGFNVVKSCQAFSPTLLGKGVFFPF
eukprot:7498453-Ditylum_brightwellii.AAC.1